jgi:hypothetical protein
MADVDGWIRYFAGYADHYHDEYLSVWDPSALETDWYEALRFFLGCMFSQGRRDEFAARFQGLALQVIQARVPDQTRLATVELGEGGPLEHELEAVGVGKRPDRLMVVSALAFARARPNDNLVAYSLACIRDRKLAQHYRELQSIASVTPEMASFYLRDLALVYDLEACIAADEYALLQPMDSWVQQIARFVGIISRQRDASAMKRAVLEACARADVNPIDFNAGAWYVATHNITPG